MSIVIAKLCLAGNSIDEYGNRNVRMVPVYEEAGINKEWADATPSGGVHLVVNPNVTPAFSEDSLQFGSDTPTKNFFAFFVPEDELTGEMAEMVSYIKEKVDAKKRLAERIQTEASLNQGLQEFIKTPLPISTEFKMSTVTFSEAVVLLKAGKKVARAGWNGKGMWLALQTPDTNSKMSLPYIYMKTADDKLVPWLASQTDILAEDWSVVVESDAPATAPTTPAAS